MGLRVYLAGTEGLIGQAMQAALEAGIDHTSIQTEHRGSLARRMQCVHCKGITEDVTTQPATCSHCGLLLLVRDHYSRRLAAFQGVCINAEDQSEDASDRGDVPMSAGTTKLDVTVSRCRPGQRTGHALPFPPARRRLLPTFSGGAHVVVEMQRRRHARGSTPIR